MHSQTGERGGLHILALKQFNVIVHRLFYSILWRRIRDNNLFVVFYFSHLNALQYNALFSFTLFSCL